MKRPTETMIFSFEKEAIKDCRDQLEAARLVKGAWIKQEYTKNREVHCLAQIVVKQADIISKLNAKIRRMKKNA